MVRQLRRFVWTACLALTLVDAAAGVRPEDQAVTFANFQYINCVATSQSKVYFATTNGIIVYNKIENRWVEPLTGHEGLPSQDIRRIWVDRFDQYLYAEINSGLYEYNFTFERWMSVNALPNIDSDDSHVSPPAVMFPPIGLNYIGGGTLADTEGRTFSINDMVDDNAGNLWIGTWGYGPARSSPGTNVIELMPYGLIQSAAYALHDEDSVLWAAGPTLNSRRTGITGYYLATNSFIYIETGLHPDLPSANVNCLSGTDKYLLIGTDVGLFLVNRQSGLADRRIGRTRGLADENITSLLVIGEDSIFVGTTAGLVLYRISTDSVHYLSQRQFFNRIIYSLAASDGYVWVGSNIGAFRLSLKTGRFQKFMDPDQVLFDRIFDIRVLGDDVWFASDGGIVLLDLGTAETTAFRISSRKLDSRAMDVNEQIAAVASERGVLFIFLNEDGARTREFSVEDGLASTYVYDLLFDGDYLWIATDQGLTRFLWNNPNRVD